MCQYKMNSLKQKKQTFQTFQYEHIIRIVEELSFNLLMCLFFPATRMKKKARNTKKRAGYMRFNAEWKKKVFSVKSLFRAFQLKRVMIPTFIPS